MFMPLGESQNPFYFFVTLDIMKAHSGYMFARILLNQRSFAFIQTNILTGMAGEIRRYLTIMCGTITDVNQSAQTPTNKVGAAG